MSPIYIGGAISKTHPVIVLGPGVAESISHSPRSWWLLDSAQRSSTPSATLCDCRSTFLAAGPIWTCKRGNCLGPTCSLVVVFKMCGVEQKCKALYTRDKTKRILQPSSRVKPRSNTRELFVWVQHMRLGGSPSSPRKGGAGKPRPRLASGLTRLGSALGFGESRPQDPGSKVTERSGSNTVVSFL